MSRPVPPRIVLRRRWSAPMGAGGRCRQRQGRGLPVDGQRQRERRAASTQTELSGRAEALPRRPQSQPGESATLGPPPETAHLSRPYIGRPRTRMRVVSMITTAPFSKSTSIAARFARNNDSRLSGLRSNTPRKRTTDGLVANRRASSVPKSVSSERIVRSCARARSNSALSLAACSPMSRTWTTS